MKPEFVRYLESIGTSQTLRERAETIFQFYRQLCPEEIVRLFASDYIARDGTRVFGALWFLSENYVMEAKDFMTKDDFDLAPIAKPLPYLRVQKEDYDFQKATDKSRLHLICGINDKVGGELKASKENCDFLRDLIREYLLPRMKV